MLVFTDIVLLLSYIIHDNLVLYMFYTCFMYVVVFKYVSVYDINIVRNYT